MEDRSDRAICARATGWPIRLPALRESFPTCGPLLSLRASATLSRSPHPFPLSPVFSSSRPRAHTDLSSLELHSGSIDITAPASCIFCPKPCTLSLTSATLSVPPRITIYSGRSIGQVYPRRDRSGYVCIYVCVYACMRSQEERGYKVKLRDDINV